MESPERTPDHADELTPDDLAHRDGPDPDPFDDPSDVLLETEEFTGADDGVVDTSDEVAE